MSTNEFDKFRELPETLWTDEEKLRAKYCNPLAEGRIDYVDENNNVITTSKDPLCEIKLIEYNSKHRNDFYFQKNEREENDRIDDYVAMAVMVLIAIIIYAALWL